MTARDDFGRLWPAPDQQLLIEAATADAGRAEAAFRKWRSGVNLDDEFRLSVLRLIPLAYHNLLRIGVSDPLMIRLKGSYRRAWYDAQQLFHRCRPAVELLLDRGLEVMLTKGAPLALSYYGNLAVRPMSDIDVCVRPTKARVAIDLLRKAGWMPLSRPTSSFLRFKHGLQFNHPDGGQIDLHWSPIREALGALAAEWAWEESEPLDFLGLAVRQPTPAVMLLHQIVHGVRLSNETQVRWIPDCLTVMRVRGHDLDWARVTQGGRRLKVSRRVALGLRHLVERYDAAVPPEVLSTLEQAPRAVPERLEEMVYLGDYERHSNNPFGVGLILLTDLCRVVSPSRPIALAAAVPGFVAHRMNIGARRNLLPALWRVARRRATDEKPQLYVTE